MTALAADPPPDAAAEPFPSFVELQNEHTALLARYAAATPAPPEAVKAVERFVGRAAATGVRLDRHRDRWAAQSLLDYWVTVLYQHDIRLTATLNNYDPTWHAQSLATARYPYPRPGQHDDAFFARPAVVKECVARLASPPHLLVVVGPLGSGRSTVVRTELLPALRGDPTKNVPGLLPGSEAWEYLAPITPGDDPAAALATLAAAATRGDRKGRRPPTLVRAVGGTRPPVVIFVDHLEELFTRGGDAAARTTFLGELRNLVRAADHPARVILVLQRGYESRAAELMDLGRTWDAAAYPIPPATGAELRAAILGPAERIGLRFEPGLVERIVADLTGHPAAFLLLQFILSEIWDRKSGDLVPTAAYTAIGRQQVVDTVAERAFQSLATDLLDFDTRQIAARRVFTKLLKLGPAEDELIPTAATQAEIDAAVPADAAPEAAARAAAANQAAVHVFAAAGLLRIRADGVEVVHPALAWQWRRLKDWLRQERRDAGFRAMLAKATEEWLRLGRSRKALWRGELLTQAAAYPGRSATETEFVIASQTARSNVERWFRRQAYVAGAALGIVILLTFLGWRAAVKALRSEERLTDTATSRELAAQAANLGPRNLDLRLLLALEAFKPHHIRDRHAKELFEQNPLPEDEGELFQALQENPRILHVLDDQPGPVYAAAYSPDGRRLATTGPGGVRLWDPDRPAKPLAVLELKTDARSLAFGQSLLAAGTIDGRVFLWTPAGEPRGEIRLGPHPGGVPGLAPVVRCLAFDPSGTRLAAGGWDGWVRLWDVADRPKPLGEDRQMPAADGAITALVFSPDGGMLAAGGTAAAARPAAGGPAIRTVYQWAVTSAGLAAAPRPLRTDAKFHTDYITALAYMADGRLLASGDGVGLLHVTNVETPDPNKEADYSGGLTPVLGLSLDPTGRTLAAAHADGQVYFHKLDPNDQVGPDDRPPLAGHRKEVWAVAYRPKAGGQLATAGGDGKVIVWNTNPDPDAVRLANPVGPAAAVKAVALSPAGTVLASADETGRVLLWDRTARAYAELPTAGRSVADLAFGPPAAEPLLAGVDRDGQLLLWRGRAAQEVKPDKPLPPTLNSFDRYGVAVSPDGTFALTWNQINPRLQLRPTGPGDPPKAITLPGHTVLGVGLAVEGQPARRTLTALVRKGGAEPCELLAWDVTNPADPRASTPPAVRLDAGAQTLAASGDGRRLAVGYVSGRLQLWTRGPAGWTPRELTRPNRPTAHADRVEKLAFTPDGAWVVSAGSDRRVGRWNAETGVGEGFRGHADVVRGVGVAVDAAGRVVLASGGDDKTVRVWEFAAGAAAPRLPAGEPLPQGRVQAIAVRPGPGGRVLAAALDTGGVVFWDADRRQRVGDIPNAHRGAVAGLAFGPDGRWLVTGGTDGKVLRWDVSDPTAVRPDGEFPAAWTDGGHPVGLAVAPDGGTVAATGTNDRVLIWQADTRAKLGELPPGTNDELPVAQRLALWDVSVKQRAEFDQANRLNVNGRVAFRPGGGLAVTLADNSIRLLNTPSAEPAADPIRVPTGRVRGLAFHPTAGVLAAGGTDNLIRFWDVRTLGEPRELPVIGRGHTAAVRAVAFGPAGRLMASTETAAGDAAGDWVLLWRVQDATGDAGRVPVRVSLLGRVKVGGGTDGVTSLAFDAAEAQLAWATAGGEVGVLDVSLDSWKRRAEAIASRQLSPGERERYLHAPAGK